MENSLGKRSIPERIQAVKDTPIEEIMLKAGYQSDSRRSDNRDQYYYSPWRDERTASLHVSKNRNEWYDHGEGVGGNAFDLALRLSGGKVKETLDWWEKNALQPSAPQMLTRQSEQREAEKSYKNTLVRVSPLRHPRLLEYETKQRGIPKEIAQSSLVEVTYYNQKQDRNYFGSGIRNQSGGYEVRNEHLKTVVGPKDITVVPGTSRDKERALVVEGMHEYLTLKTMAQGRKHQDIIITSSASLGQAALDYIRQKDYKAVALYGNNDKAGQKMVQKFADQLGDKFHDRTHLYASHKDLNDYWVDTGRTVFASQGERDPLRDPVTRADTFPRITSQEQEHYQQLAAIEKKSSNEDAEIDR